MPDDKFRARFIHIRDLLTQAAQGIAEGNRALVEKAATNYGTLAVKSAELTVDFVLSSNAPSQDGKEVGVGANTLFGFVPGLGLIQDSLAKLTSNFGAAATAALGPILGLQQEVSRAKVVLNIVPIVPPELNPQPAIDPVQLAAEIARVLSAITDPKISEADKKVLLVKLADIANLLKAGKFGDANAALQALIAQYPELAKS